MSEDLRKTILQPRFANRMSYHTVVMEQPPEMGPTASVRPTRKTAPTDSRHAPRHVRPARFEAQLSTSEKFGRSRIDPPAAVRPTVPRATHIPASRTPAKSTTIGKLRTRMVNAQALPTFQNEVSVQRPTGVAGGAPLLPPAMTTMQIAARDTSSSRHRRTRIAFLVGIAAIVLGAGLAKVLSGSAGISEPPSADRRAIASRLNEVDAGPSAMSPTAIATEQDSTIGVRETLKMSTSQEAAAKALLAGRRTEALALYRMLAASSDSTSGIEAMAEVLEQKVAVP